MYLNTENNVHVCMIENGSSLSSYTDFKLSGQQPHLHLLPVSVPYSILLIENFQICGNLILGQNFELVNLLEECY